MAAARSVRDEPAVETSCASHMSTKSRLRKTAGGDTCTTAWAWLTEPPRVPRHRLPWRAPAPLAPGEPPLPGPRVAPAEAGSQCTVRPVAFEADVQHGAGVIDEVPR